MGVKCPVNGSPEAVLEIVDHFGAASYETQKGEPLSEEEQRVYQTGLAALEAEEWAERQPVAELLRPLQEQLRALTARG